ncbi:hypothetical protein LOC67_23465 [Stieleria sp. JC731]|uniref:hypothetical protein n=1 Tax=Pirellulaceae TaxID=2691357 RepID=UPI001E422A5F|nr:hypothetical protein [Stieleria sp. JC731]MCC9603519.1 hypothetical protein [Stieleria sp. JC731]
MDAADIIQAAILIVMIGGPIITLAFRSVRNSERIENLDARLETALACIKADRNEDRKEWGDIRVILSDLKDVVQQLVVIERIRSGKDPMKDE